MQNNSFPPTNTMLQINILKEQHNGRNSLIKDYKDRTIITTIEVCNVVVTIQKNRDRKINNHKQIPLFTRAPKQISTSMFCCLNPIVSVIQKTCPIILKKHSQHLYHKCIKETCSVILISQILNIDVSGNDSFWFEFLSFQPVFFHVLLFAKRISRGTFFE